VFIQRAVFQPIPERVPALREALLALNTPANPVTVLRRIWGGLEFIVLGAHESLAAYEDWYRRFTPDPKLQGLYAAVSWELWEQTVARPSGPPPKFTARFTYHAASLPAMRELRSLVEEHRIALNAAGAAFSVAIAASGAGQAIHAINAFQGLAEWEWFRATGLASSATLAFAQKIAPLLAKPAEPPEVFEIRATPARA